MDIDNFLIEFSATPAYQIYPEVRQLVGAFRLRLVSVGMFCGDKGVNDKETIQILTEFKQQFSALIKQLSGAELDKPGSVNPSSEPASKILTPEAQKKLLAVLETRYEEHNKNPKFREKRKNIDWQFLQAILESNPEKLWSLNEMERTGGEPDLVDYDPSTNEYVFMDCSAESPEGRRYICYDREGQEFAEEGQLSPDGNAVEMAKEMGIEILNAEQYELLQSLDRFDLHSRSWLLTPEEMLHIHGKAKVGGRKIIPGLTFFPDKICSSDEEETYDFNEYKGFRGVLRI